MLARYGQKLVVPIEMKTILHVIAIDQKFDIVNAPMYYKSEIVVSC